MPAFHFSNPYYICAPDTSPSYRTNNLMCLLKSKISGVYLLQLRENITSAMLMVSSMHHGISHPDNFCDFMRMNLAITLESFHQVGYEGHYYISVDQNLDLYMMEEAAKAAPNPALSLLIASIIMIRALWVPIGAQLAGWSLLSLILSSYVH